MEAKGSGGTPPKKNKSSHEVFSGYQSRENQNQVVPFRMHGGVSSAHFVKIANKKSAQHMQYLFTMH
eukprot:911981-Ditylum_brightwellii.AAC.1